MSRKNKSKQSPQLSPENYIRQKARNLPVYECLVNGDWEDSKMVNVVVSRLHANGNITAGFYLVDLFCLGVKNTTYFFNYSPIEYKEQIQKMMHLSIKQIPYELAHNIVFAGLAYATELGFNPHKEFTSLTRFILEEDTEEVELIEIECGRNGKPFYMQGQFDSEQMANRVMAQLVSSVGKGNFDFALDANEDINGDKYDEEDFEDDTTDDNEEISLDEKRDLFFKLHKRIDIFNEEESKTFHNLIFSVFNGFINKNLLNELTDFYKNNLKIDLLPLEAIPFELWGVEPDSITITDELNELFVKVFVLLNEDTKLARKKLKELKKKVGDIPAVRMLGIMILQTEGEVNYFDITDDNLEKFSDYPIFQLQKICANAYKDTDSEDLLMDLLPLNQFFKNRISLHEIEFMNYIFALVNLIIKEVNPTKIEALLIACNNIGLPEKIEINVTDFLTSVKYNFVRAYFFANKGEK